MPLVRFTGVQKYTIWDLMSDNTKIEDEKTTQLNIDGENRGQTQRYLGAIGQLVKELFDKIDESFRFGLADQTSFDFLEFLQRATASRYIEVTAGNEALIRDFQAEIITAWKLKGTQLFLFWIIYKVFGWRLVNILTLASEVLITNSSTSFLYTDDLPPEENKVLFDPGLFTPDDKMSLIIDVFLDAQFLEKKVTLESLLDIWSYPAFPIYLNTP